LLPGEKQEQRFAIIRELSNKYEAHNNDQENPSSVTRIDARVPRNAVTQGPGGGAHGVRQFLGLKSGDKVAFVLANDQVRLIRKGSPEAATAGMFKPHAASGRSAKHLRAAVEQAMAEEGAGRSAA
jgi:hypothetical protein